MHDRTNSRDGNSENSTMRPGNGDTRVDEVSLVDLRCSIALMRKSTFLLVRRDETDDWVLPGGRPQPGESMAACVRRETREETGLDVRPSRCALVLEVIDPLRQRRVVELVFVADATDLDGPVSGEPGTTPEWVSGDRLRTIKLRPPIAGHLPNLSVREARGASYLGNMWRPDEARSWRSDAWAGGE